MAFIVDAAEFDGATELTRANFIANSSQLTVTGFFNTSSAASVQAIYTFDTLLSNAGYLYTDGTLEFAFSDGTFLFVVTSSVSGLNDGAGHSFQISVDTNFSAGNKIVYLAIDDAVDTPTIIDLNPAFNIRLATTDYYVGSLGGGQYFVGCLAEITANPQLIDITNATNRHKFVTAANKPENIGSDGSTAYGSAAAMYLHLDDAEAPANFALNAGTGGDFTITGTLTTCATSPSDGGGGDTYTLMGQASL